jgi:hypothetical protein
LTAYLVSLARIPGRSFLIELEELPPYIERRTVAEGQLPLDYRAAPRRIDLPPYNGRNVAAIEGPAGEWLELID